jgi:hypothetical protein
MKNKRKIIRRVDESELHTINSKILKKNENYEW